MSSKRVDADEARLQHNIVSDYSKCKGGICIWIVDVLHLGRAIKDWPSLCGHFQMISRTLFDALYLARVEREKAIVLLQAK
jgi:hypothetical protein